MNIALPAMKLGGRFRLVTSKDAECMEVVEDTGFFSNLITDVGMHRIGTVTTPYAGLTPMQSFDSLCGGFVVGTGSTVPSFSDTSLDNPVVAAPGTAVLVSESSNYTRGWYEVTVKHQFGRGVAQGNLSEIGIQLSSLVGPLWSRALILDGQGNPTTITVRSSDILTCFYTLRIMIPKEDVVYNINVDYGEDGIIPTIVTGRALGANNASALTGWRLRTAEEASGARTRFYDGGLSSPTANTPLGSHVGSVEGGSIVPYDPVNSPYKRWFKQSAGLNTLNSTNLRTASITMLMGYWQLEFNPPLQKNNTQSMDLTFGYSWARA